MFTKVCGLTTQEQIDWAIELGYSAIGIVLYPKSPRFCEATKAAELANYATGKIPTVAVSKSFEDIRPVASAFDFIQVYEELDIPNLIYAGSTLPENGRYAYFIYDTSVGSGVFHELPEWLKDIHDKLIISGGLSIENISTIINNFRPFGVDISSGVEHERGIKDFDLMKKFIEEVRNASS